MLIIYLRQLSPSSFRFTVTDRILEMKKGSRAAVSGKGWRPKPRQKISDIADFQKKKLEIAIFRSWSSKKEKTSETNVYKSL